MRLGGAGGDLSTFYAVVSAACFTLVGLWWNVLERRPELTATPDRRRAAGSVHLSFFLPAVMGLFAQVDPSNPLVWRTTFGAAALVGGTATARGALMDRRIHVPSSFRRTRWVVVVLYLVIAALGSFPRLAGSLGLTGLQGAAAALVLLIAFAHGLAWLFLIGGTTEGDRPD